MQNMEQLDTVDCVWCHALASLQKDSYCYLGYKSFRSLFVANNFFFALLPGLSCYAKKDVTGCFKFYRLEIMTTSGTPSLTDELPYGEGLMVTTHIRDGQRLLFIPVTAVCK